MTHTEEQMKYVICIIFGMVLATVGFSGIARIFDRGVDSIKSTSQELSK
jgi:hypothetical protein